MMSCGFCDIVSGESQTEIIFSDDHVITFTPLHPATLGHMIIVPKAHSSDIWDTDTVIARHLMDATMRLAHATRRALHPDGLNVINSSGRAASQSVFHMHIHILPRWLDDGFGDIWPTQSNVSDEQARQAEDRVRAALG